MVGLRLITKAVAWLFATVLLPAGTAAASGTAKHETPEYVLTAVATPDSPQQGKTGHLTISIEPKSPHALKIQTPLTATLQAPPALGLAQKAFTAKDFVDPIAYVKRLKTSFVPTAAGDHSVKLQLMFFLCTAELCQRYTDELALAVRAEAPPAP